MQVLHFKSLEQREQVLLVLTQYSVAQTVQMVVSMEEQVVHPATQLWQTPLIATHPVLQVVQLLFPVSVQEMHLGSSQRTQLGELVEVKRYGAWQVAHDPSALQVAQGLLQTMH